MRPHLITCLAITETHKHNYANSIVIFRYNWAKNVMSDSRKYLEREKMLIGSDDNDDDNVGG